MIRAVLTVSVLFWLMGGLTACSIIADVPEEEDVVQKPAIEPVRIQTGVKIVGQKKTSTLTGASVNTPTTSGSKTSVAFARNAINDPSSPLSRKTVYFSYNKSDILSEYKDVIYNHARYLADYPNVSVRLEGHTDERASREYNIALGERRTASVLRQLLWQGAGINQVSTISYGEEKPASSGRNEQSWARNRRVEFVYEAP